MKTPATVSIVGFRWNCSRAMRRMARSSHYGVITDAKITRIGWFTWHLEFKAVVK